MISPIPGSTSEIGGFCIIRKREEALSILKIISIIADSAKSSCIMLFTIIRNWNTDFFIIESPSFRAGEANLVGPVPCATSEITWCGGVGRGINTLSSTKIISTKAGQAISSSLIKGVTLSTDGNA